MSYPSIISQPGSAQRNLPVISQGLAPLIADLESKESSSTAKTPQILELGSFPYVHISSFAQRWPNVEWWGSCRDRGEVETVKEQVFGPGSSTPGKNLLPPTQLDITSQSDWDNLANVLQRRVQPGAFNGVMIFNVIHCCPEDVPENVFKHLSPRTAAGRRLLDPVRGWVAAYGAFKNDDGSYRSEADQEFDASYIRARDQRLGLRTVEFVSDMARRWGFVEESRTVVGKGNLFIVWRVEG